MTTASPRGGSPMTRLLRWADEHQPAGAMATIFHLLVRILLICAMEFQRNKLSLRASALTYTILLSLVPILAMSTALYKGLGGGDQLKEAAYRYINTLEQSTSTEPPPSETATLDATTPVSSTLTAHLRAAADKLFAYVEEVNFATIGIFGLIGLFLSVLLVLDHIEMAMNAIWQVDDGRSLLRKVSDYLALLILTPISLNIAFTAAAFRQNQILFAKFTLLFPFLWLQTLLLKLVPVFFIALTLSVVYIFFPNTKVRAMPALIGATLAAILWFSVQNIYISLQVGVANYNAIYGSFATLPLFLIWIYLGMLFILGGAQLAFACQQHRTYRLLAAPGQVANRISTALAIMTAVQNAFRDQLPLVPADLIDHLPDQDPHLISDVTTELAATELLHVSVNTGQLLPAGPPDQIGPEQIIEKMLLGNQSSPSWSTGLPTVSGKRQQEPSAT